MNKSVRMFGVAVGATIAAGMAGGCEVITKISHGVPSVKGTGPVKQEDRKVSGFKSVSIGNGFQMDIKIGLKESVKIEAQENLLPLITTKVENGQLQIEINDSMESDKPLLAHITVPSLEGVTVCGGAQGSVEGLAGKAFDAHASGGARLKVVGNAKNLSIDASGGSEVLFDAVDCEKLDVNASGASSILLKGKASEAKVMTEGASQFKCEGLSVGSADVHASGASQVALDVTGSLEAEATGASTIRYSGEAKVHSSASGASNIQKNPKS